MSFNDYLDQDPLSTGDQAPQVTPMERFESRGTSLVLGAVTPPSVLQRVADMNGLTPSQQCLFALNNYREHCTVREIIVPADAHGEELTHFLLDTFVTRAVDATQVLDFMVMLDFCKVNGFHLPPNGGSVKAVINRMANDERMKFLSTCTGLVDAHPENHVVDPQLTYPQHECSYSAESTTDLDNLLACFTNVKNGLCFELLRGPQEPVQKTTIMILRPLFDDDEDAVLTAGILQRSFDFDVAVVKKISEYGGNGSVFLFCPKNNNAIAFVQCKADGQPHELLSGNIPPLCGYTGFAKLVDQAFDIELKEKVEPNQGDRALCFEEADLPKARSMGACQIAFEGFILNRHDVVLKRDIKRDHAPASTIAEEPKPVLGQDAIAGEVSRVYPNIDPDDIGAAVAAVLAAATTPQQQQHVQLAEQAQATTVSPRPSGRPTEEYTNMFRGPRESRSNSSTPRPTTGQTNGNQAQSGIQLAPRWEQPFLPGSGSVQHDLPPAVPSWGIRTSPLIPVKEAPVKHIDSARRQTERFGGIPLSEFSPTVQSAILSISHPGDLQLITNAVSKMFSAKCSDRLLMGELGRAEHKVREWRSSIRPCDTKTIRKNFEEGGTRGRYFTRYFEWLAPKSATGSGSGDAFVMLMLTICIIQSQSSMIVIRADGTVVANQ